MHAWVRSSSPLNVYRLPIVHRRPSRLFSSCKLWQSPGKEESLSGIQSEDRLWSERESRKTEWIWLSLSQDTAASHTSKELYVMSKQPTGSWWGAAHHHLKLYLSCLWCRSRGGCPCQVRSMCWQAPISDPCEHSCKTELSRWIVRPKEQLSLASSFTGCWNLRRPSTHKSPSCWTSQ